mgnify:CR=1 FL=1
MTEHEPEPVYWYRFVDSDQEWSRDPYEYRFPVVRYTRKCVVLNWYGKDKFVLLDARKRFAYPTRELAMESYIRRKQVEVSMMAARHDRAVEYLAAAKEMQDRGLVREEATSSAALERLMGGPCPPVSP